jgi:two-component system OmpR family sensor kinase
MQPDRPKRPYRERWIDVAWGLFSVLNLIAILLIPEWETVPFHFIWVSLTLLYGFRVWRTRPTLAVLAVVMASTGLFIGIDTIRGEQPPDELTEVPLMAAMFLAMVWHARRRVAATAEVERISMANARLVGRQRRFVQDASHELRTPITVALGHAELIQRTTTDPTIASDASVISDELLRLRRLADRLLLLASTEDPQFLHRTPVDLRITVEEALHRWAAAPRRWSFGALHDAVVLADAERLGVALDALIENAIAHTTDGDEIELSVRATATTAVASVRDTGAGIAPADLDRVFERFARADPGRSRHTGGFGLGLPIVRAIAEAHEGSVGVRSAPGAGSTFEITLPLLGSAPDPPSWDDRARLAPEIAAVPMDGETHAADLVT